MGVEWAAYRPIRRRSAKTALVGLPTSLGESPVSAAGFGFGAGFGCHRRSNKRKLLVNYYARKGHAWRILDVAADHTLTQWLAQRCVEIDTASGPQQQVSPRPVTNSTGSSVTGPYRASTVPVPCAWV